MEGRREIRGLIYGIEKSGQDATNEYLTYLLGVELLDEYYSSDFGTYRSAVAEAERGNASAYSANDRAREERAGGLEGTESVIDFSLATESHLYQ